jgi:hypothetical protein
MGLITQQDRKVKVIFSYPLLVFRLCGIICSTFISVQETGMLLEDLKQQLDNLNGRLETLRRHL